MQVDFQAKRPFISTNIAADPGYYALDSSPISWEKCRERFAVAFTRSLNGFYFYHERFGSANVAAFILKTEEILKERTHSKFSETGRDMILWVEPSDFWKSCPMRRSLLTILLRCGMVYKCESDNYEDALFSHEYIVPTRMAMMRFLFGFTKYIGPDMTTDSSLQVRGWKAIFESKDANEVKEWLVSEEKTTYKPMVELYKRLWY